MGIDFEIIPGKGPKIKNKIANRADVEAVKILSDVNSEVPFLSEILSALRKETDGKTSLIGK